MFNIWQHLHPANDETTSIPLFMPRLGSSDKDRSQPAHQITRFIDLQIDIVIIYTAWPETQTEAQIKVMHGRV